MTTTTTIPSIGTGQGANPLKGLLAYGQSPWMDYIRRDLLTSGQLKKYIENDGLRGMTSNPAIFEKAITGSNLYTEILTSPEAKKLDANGLFEKIAIRDVQDACDIFKPVYVETKRRDGYVSLEASTFLGFDTKAPLPEDRPLRKRVKRARPYARRSKKVSTSISRSSSHSPLTRKSPKRSCPPSKLALQRA